MGADYSHASASILTGGTDTSMKASGSLTLSSSFFASSGSGDEIQITVGSTEYRFISADSGNVPADNSPVFYYVSGSDGTAGATSVTNLNTKINASDV